MLSWRRKWFGNLCYLIFMGNHYFLEGGKIEVIQCVLLSKIKQGEILLHFSKKESWFFQEGFLHLRSFYVHSMSTNWFVLCSKVEYKNLTIFRLLFFSQSDDFRFVCRSSRKYFMIFYVRFFLPIHCFHIEGEGSRKGNMLATTFIL